MSTNILDNITDIKGGDERIAQEGRTGFTLDQEGKVVVETRLIPAEGTAVPQSWTFSGDKKVWIVFHGWNEVLSDFVGTANKIQTARPDDVVFLLDWTEASGADNRRNREDIVTPLGSNKVSRTGGEFISSSWSKPIADKLYQRLRDLEAVAITFSFANCLAN